MEIQTLIEKLQTKHYNLLSEYSKGNKSNELLELYRSQMKDILELIEDIKNLTLFGLFDPQSDLMFVHKTYEGCEKHKVEFEKQHGFGFYTEEIIVLD